MAQREALSCAYGGWSLRGNAFINVVRSRPASSLFTAFALNKPSPPFMLSFFLLILLLLPLLVLLLPF
jgi:hypothetical protein